MRGVAIGERKRGEPLTPAAILAGVDTIPEAGCWIWRGAPHKTGYGVVGVGGASRKAHRVSYEVHKGPVPDGLAVMHVCDTRMCVNPDHLRVGTWADNNRDRHAKGRCAKKLSDDDVIRILEDERRQAQIARDYGVDQSTISDIRRGKRRSLLTGIKQESSAWPK